MNGDGFKQQPRDCVPQPHTYIRRTEPAQIQVEDDRTGMSLETLQRAFMDNLFYLLGKNKDWATAHDYYMALAYTVRDRLIYRWLKTVQQTYFQKDIKVVCYLSAEYLLGRQLGKNLVNLGLYEQTRQMVQTTGFALSDLLEQEEEPGLGNGGLGRLAACFMDSLAALELPAVGYGLRYEYGIFQQTIENGWQVENPDRWLRFGNPWEIPRLDYTVEVKFGGHTESFTNDQGRYQVRWVPDTTVLGMPYDTLIPGYNTNTVNTLRLWSAQASKGFDLQIFNSGDFARAVAAKTASETITKVLYPNDANYQGRELRLEQEYFFVSCSLQDIIYNYLQTHTTFDRFPDRVAIQINDTHPAIGIVELMRLLIDDHQLDWDQAWSITQKTFAFTNHTMLAEALERWSVNLFSQLLPRHLELIFEINQRFLDQVRLRHPNDTERVRQLSLIEEGAEKQVRMANLACLGSHSINGVAKLHTELIKQHLFHGFYELYPTRFNNKTNGITPRRWLLLANPKLALLVTSTIGKGWIKDLDQLQQLEPFIDDPDFCQQWQRIKQENKNDLAEYILKTNGVTVNANSLFDVQVKRIHEYKRQLLNVLHVITLYNFIKQHPTVDVLPRTVIFAGKAAPGYYVAKLIIKLINSVAQVVNHDPDIADRLKVVFLANYNVSLAERIIPAADLSEHISMAGKEASGTSNMKFALNGSLSIGTLDGANIEIRQQVGADNFFLFGLSADQVSQLKSQGYTPRDYYTQNASLRQAIDQLASGYFSPQEPDLFQPLTDALLNRDEYLLCADYASYIDCQKQVSHAYQDQTRWTRMSILNSARIGYFSGDRTIHDYAQDIWQVQPVAVRLDAEKSLSLDRQG